ncbi:MAG: hypothetical protein K6G55_05100 [Selenomonadaceae bacterium]|nr:hypothetical protein [Selenomonadaceae bacterium]
MIDSFVFDLQLFAGSKDIAYATIKTAGSDTISAGDYVWSDGETVIANSLVDIAGDSNASVYASVAGIQYIAGASSTIDVNGVTNVQEVSLTAANVSLSIGADADGFDVYLATLGSGSVGTITVGDDVYQYQKVTNNSSTDTADLFVEENGGVTAFNFLENGDALLMNEAGSTLLWNGLLNYERSNGSTVELNEVFSIISEDEANDDLWITLNDKSADEFIVSGLTADEAVALGGASTIKEIPDYPSFGVETANTGASVAVAFDVYNTLFGSATIEGAKVNIYGVSYAITVNGSEVNIIGGESNVNKFTYNALKDSHVIELGLGDGTSVVSAGAASSIVIGGMSTSVGGDGTIYIGSESFRSNAQNNLTFTVEKGSIATAVDYLDQGETIFASDISDFISVNGQSFVISGDDDGAIIGGGKHGKGVSLLAGIGGDDVVIKGIGGANEVQTDKEGSFTFAIDGNSAVTYTIEDDSAVTFVVDNYGAVTNIGSLDADGAVVVEGDVSVKVNDEDIAITGASSVSIFGGVSGASVTSIELSGGSSVEITEIGSAQSVVAADGTFTFATGDEFAVEGSAVFEMSGNEVASVSGLSATDAIAAESDIFSDLSVNGQTVKIEGDKDSLTLYGNSGENGISKITGVGGGSTSTVTVTNAAGASSIETNTDGTFVIAKKTFKVAGDSNVEFVLDEDGAVTGINGVDSIGASISGAINGIEINGASLAISNVDESGLTYVYGGESSATIGGVAASGSSVASITAVAGANVINITGSGEYVSPHASIPVTVGLADDDDGINFIINAADGNLSITSFGVGDSLTSNIFDVALVAGGSSEIENLSVTNDESGVVLTNTDNGFVLADVANGAMVASGSGTLTVVTEELGEDEFKILDGNDGSAGLTFIGGASGTNVELVMEDGKFTKVASLGESATLKGALNDLKSINGLSVSIIDKDDSFAVVGGTSSSLSKIIDVTGNATLANVQGATEVVIDLAGDFTFSDGAVIGISGVDNATFTLDGSVKGKATGVSGISNTDTFIDGFIDNSADGAYAEVQSTLAAAGFTVNGESVDITGDDGTLKLYGGAGASGIGAIAGVGGASAGTVTISDAGSAQAILTDKEGTFVIAGQSFTTDDTEVAFGLSNGAVNSVAMLEGSLTADNAVLTGEGFSVNGKSVAISGDEGDLTVLGSDSSIEAIYGVGAASGTVSVDNSAMGATEIVTDVQNGTFVFASGQSFTQALSDSAAVTYTMDDDSSVTAINGISSGTLTMSSKASIVAVDINGKEFRVENPKETTLTFVDGEITAVGTIASGELVYGLENASVTAEGTISVNGKYFDVKDDDSSYGLLVKDSVVTALYDVTGGTDDYAVIKGVSSMTITADADGLFAIGGESYTITDDNNEFEMVTDADGKLSSISSLSGSIVIEDGTGTFTINDQSLEISNGSSAAVTVTTDGTKITAIDGLVDGAVLEGDFSSAALTTEGNGTFTINDNTYELTNDSDGIVVTNAGESGIGKVTDLDDDANLTITESGTYSVNTDPSVLDVKEGQIITGINDGAAAYIYENTQLVRKGTSMEQLEELVGISTEGFSAVGDGSVLGMSAMTEIINSAASAGGEFAYGGVSYNMNDDLTFSITNDGNVEQVVDLSDYEGAKKVDMYEGDQTVVFGDEEQNVAHVTDKATGEKEIELGDAGDLVVMDADGASVTGANVIGGKGNDTVIVRGDAETTIDMSEGGEDLIITYAAANADVSVTGYEASTGAAIRFDELGETDIAKAYADGTLEFEDGKVKVVNGDNSSTIDVGSEDNVTKVNVKSYGESAAVQTVVFTSSEGGATVDESENTDDLLIIGNRNDASAFGSKLNSGSGDDTVYAGGNDSVNAGAGDNTIVLGITENRDGALIELASGNNTISNLISGTDALQFAPKDITNAVVDENGNLVLESDEYTAVISGASVGENGYTEQLIKDSETGEVDYIAFGTQSGTIKVDEDADTNIFYGNDSTLDFSDVDDDIVVDLDKDYSNKIGTKDIAVAGTFSEIVAGSGQAIIKGNDGDDAVQAGQGRGFFYGAGGDNTMTGYQGDDKEQGSAFFVLSSNDGATNTVTNMEFADSTNIGTTADEIIVQVNDANIENVEVDEDGNVSFNVVGKKDGVTESVVVEDAAGKDIIVDGVVAQVNDTELTFDGEADFYRATGSNATVTVAESLTSAVVWLEEEATGKTFSGDIAVIDATNSSAKAELAGNSGDNEIYAGTGDTSLWGGSGGNDLLYGNTGADSFYYGIGNGNDTVSGMTDGDVVVLFDMTLDDIASTTTENNVVVNFKDGSSLTINDDDKDVSFKVTGSSGEGTWKLDENREFTEA